MKKIFSGLVLIAVLMAMAAAPLAALAQPMEGCTLKHDLSSFDEACTKEAEVNDEVTSAWGMCCLLDAVYTVTDWIFFGLVSIVGVLVVYGGFTITTAGGNPENVKKGKDLIMYAMVGMAVALLSKAVPSIVKTLIGA